MRACIAGWVVAAVLGVHVRPLAAEPSIAVVAFSGPRAARVQRAVRHALEREPSISIRAVPTGATAVLTGKVSRSRARWVVELSVWNRAGVVVGSLTVPVIRGGRAVTLSRSTIRRHILDPVHASSAARVVSLTDRVIARFGPGRRSVEVATAATEHARPASHGTVTGEHVLTQFDGARRYRLQTSAARRRGAIAIDGKLDEVAWQAAPETLLDWMGGPREGGTATGPTFFRVLYDDEAMYFSARAVDPEPTRIASRLFRPYGFENNLRSDWVAVLVDPMLSRRTGYGFMINPDGIVLDYVIMDDDVADADYDSVYEVGTSRVSDGWNVEFRLPYSQLRVRNGSQDRWGLQVQRRFARTLEYNFWSPMRLSSSQIVSAFGDLRIDDRLDVNRGLQITPYVSAGARIEGVDDGNELVDPLTPTVGAGADLVVQLTSSIRLFASINPDFGQVEADPAEVNLTSQETFFTEKRPLFVKDRDLYRFDLGNDELLFYSRRIGAPPQLSRDGTAPYVDEAKVTTIWGAAKAAGELPGGINFGTLSALTAEEGSTAQSDTGEISDAVIEPMAVFNVVQLGRRFRGGKSDLRMSMTATNRLLAGTDIESLHRQAYTGGAHYQHQFAGSWSLFGQVAGSYVEGPPQAIALTQQRSQRYFQRPDASHVELDPDRTHLEGSAFQLSLTRVDGARWGAQIGARARSPEFETNDAGFLRDADIATSFGSVSYTSHPNGFVERWTLETSGDAAIDWSGQRLAEQVSPGATVVFDGGSELHGSIGYLHRTLDTKLLRGGPAVAGDDAATATAGYATSPSAPLNLALDASYTTRPDSDSHLLLATAELRWALGHGLELGLGPQLILNVDDAQFVAAAADAMAAPHHLLARVDQRTTAITTRLTYTMTPRLFLDLYAQPFLSAGSYSEFKEPANARSSSYGERYREVAAADDMATLQVDADGDGTADYAVPRPDFSITSLTSNAVLRWEYRPGSLLSVIWSQSRSGLAGDGTLDPDDYADVWRGQGEHVFLVKLSYWWDY